MKKSEHDAVKFDEPVKIRKGVMPANAGIQNILKTLDPGVRRDDSKRELQTFYQTVKFEPMAKRHRVPDEKPPENRAAKAKNKPFKMRGI